MCKKVNKFLVKVLCIPSYICCVLFEFFTTQGQTTLSKIFDKNTCCLFFMSGEIDMCGVNY